MSAELPAGVLSRAVRGASHEALTQPAHGWPGSFSACSVRLWSSRSRPADYGTSAGDLIFGTALLAAAVIAAFDIAWRNASVV